MAAPVPLRPDFDAAALCTLAKQSRDPDQTRRLLALATIYDGQPRSEAARIASRVFPTPPGPTKVTRRASLSFLRVSASSWRRPTKLVVSAGRFPDVEARLATGRPYCPEGCGDSVDSVPARSFH